MRGVRWLRGSGDTWHDKCHVSSLYKGKSESGENSVEEKKKKRKKERKREKNKGKREKGGKEEGQQLLP